MLFMFTCASASSHTSGGMSEHSAAQSQKVERTPCGTALISNLRSASGSSPRRADCPTHVSRGSTVSAVELRRRGDERVLASLDREDGARYTRWLESRVRGETQEETIRGAAGARELTDARRKRLDTKRDALHDLQDELFRSITDPNKVDDAGAEGETQ